MAYPTIDYLPDLTASEMSTAIPLTLGPMTANSVGWDVGVTIARSDKYAILTDIYKVTLTEGAIADFASTSFFEPFILEVFDQFGNVVAVANDDTYGSDYIFNYRVPYTGTFYVEASWNQGDYYTSVTLGVYEDLPNSVVNPAPSSISGSNVTGGTGNDIIIGIGSQTTLRGGDGNDSIIGAAGFDDINGNRGNDTAYGGDGDDWVVGGQDQDLLHGDAGFDIVYGNLGNDTIFGDVGNDWVRGGQGDDVVDGGAGNDWLWGDRGNDTITGGAGADLIHSFSGAGIDRVTDFNYSQGDRIVLDDRTAYVVTQVGGDAVITIGGVDQVILAGVQASSLGAGAIFYA